MEATERLQPCPCSPPWGSHDCSEPHVDTGRCSSECDDEEQWLGPTRHLIAQLPPILPTAQPPISTIIGILLRAELEIEIVALAGRILSALATPSIHSLLPFDDRWRAFEQQQRQQRNLAAAARSRNSWQYKVSPSADILVLAALEISSKFLEDYREHSDYFAHSWGGGLWPTRLVNKVEGIILEHLNWDLLSLWQQPQIGEVVRAMRRAGRRRESGMHLGPGDGTRETILGLGDLPSPARTPTGEIGDMMRS